MKGNVDKTTLILSIILSAVAFFLSLTIDQKSSIVGILTTISLIGPTSLAVITIVERRASKRNAARSVFPIALLLGISLRAVTQSEGCISLLFRNNFDLGFRKTPSPLSSDNCLREAIKKIESQKFRLRYAIENPNIEKSSTLPYSRGMLSYPDFNWSLSIISSIDKRIPISPVLMVATIAKNWYADREMIFSHDFEHGDGSTRPSMLNHTVGTPAAKAYAELNDRRTSSTLSVYSINYLESVERSLIHVHSVLTWLDSEIHLPERDWKLIQSIVNMILCDGRLTSQGPQYSAI